jgi:ABC-type Na+ transport system ATPase subunit NatA
LKGDRVPARSIKALSFDVYPGRVTALFGPNGAGHNVASRRIVEPDRGLIEQEKLGRSN